MDIYIYTKKMGWEGFNSSMYMRILINLQENLMYDN